MEMAEDPVPQQGALLAALGRRSIVLIGMMGAGKSSIGRRLAQRLGLPFVDADTEIEAAHAGVTIAEIFASYGEPYFRSGEQLSLIHISEPTRLLSISYAVFCLKKKNLH